MPELQRSVMRRLYGRDVWEGFRPARPPQGGVQGWNGDHPALAQLACLAPQNRRRSRPTRRGGLATGAGPTMILAVACCPMPAV